MTENQTYFHYKKNKKAENEIREACQGKTEHKVICLTGEPSSGKTSFLKLIQKEFQDRVQWVDALELEEVLVKATEQGLSDFRKSEYVKDRAKIVILEDMDEVKSESMRKMILNLFSEKLVIAETVEGFRRVPGDSMAYFYKPKLNAWDVHKQVKKMDCPISWKERAALYRIKEIQQLNRALLKWQVEHK